MVAIQGVATSTPDVDAAANANTVAVVNADVTSKDANTLAAFFAIMMASANQASQDFKQGQADLEKLKGQLDAKYIADAINGTSSIDELNDLLDALKKLGMDGPGLDSARTFIKDNWAEYQKQKAKAKSEAAKAGWKWDDSAVISGGIAGGVAIGFAIGGPLGAAVGGIIGGLGALFGKANNKAMHGKNAQNAQDAAQRASNNVSDRLNHLKTGLGGEGDKLSQTQSSLNGKNDSISGISGFMNTLSGAQ